MKAPRTKLQFPKKLQISSSNRAVCWNHRLKNGTLLNSSPVAADQRIYIASVEGVVVVLEAGEKFNILATNKLDGGILATPALIE
jgi:outer membrane protein assembly factor BamB